MKKARKDDEGAKGGLMIDLEWGSTLLARWNGTGTWFLLLQYEGTVFPCAAVLVQMPVS